MFWALSRFHFGRNEVQHIANSLACHSDTIHNNTAAHIDARTMRTADAQSPHECCALCSARGVVACETWSYRPDGGKTKCHMSAEAPLNMSTRAGYAYGTVAKSPTAPPTSGPPAAGTKPHIIVWIADDLGYANVGYTRAASSIPPALSTEVRTPVIDELVASGIELMRNYVYKVCSPTRSSFQSGRLPVHVNVANTEPTVSNPNDPISGFQGIPRNMTCIAEKLQEAGYRTHQIGKWDVGMATREHTPKGRGYDTSFGYFHHDNDFWTERTWEKVNDTGYSKQCKAILIDMYRGKAGGDVIGAIGENGTAPTSSNWSRVPPGCNGTIEAFEESKFAAEALTIIAAHPSPHTTPLFLNYDLHIAHEPIELPRPQFEAQRLLTEASGVGDFENRRTTYQGMVNFMDEIIGNVTALLKKRGMWSNTLYIFSSDNGGPSFQGSHHLAANNYPLRGSKASDWEGGYRAVGFLAGGFIATAIPHRAGAKLSGSVHIADWYATVCALAGVDPRDDRAAAANLPAVDSLNLWPYLAGEASTSPRVRVHLSDTALVDGEYKIIINNAEFACWGGPLYPNASTASGPLYPGGTVATPCKTSVDCGTSGCLFNVETDAEERHNLASDPAHAALLQSMRDKLAAANAGNFNPVRGSFDPRACAAAERNGGYWGPFA